MDVTLMTSFLVLLVFLLIAVVQDLRTLKVSNRLILAGISAAIPLRILSHGVGEIVWILPNILIPVIILYLFYLAGALGAADIKLFSLVGCYLNFKELWYCIIVSFFAGALLALFKMLYSGSFRQRMYSGFYYMCELAKGDIKAYENVDDENVVHFSIAILVGVVVVKAYTFLI